VDAYLLLLWCEELSESILLLLVDKNPYLEPEIVPKGCCSGNHTKPIKPPMIFVDGMLTEEG